MDVANPSRDGPSRSLVVIILVDNDYDNDLNPEPSSLHLARIVRTPH
jgi:hypothetical protein